MGERRPWRELGEMLGWTAAATILPSTETRDTHAPTSDSFRAAQSWREKAWLTRAQKHRLYWWAGLVLAALAILFALVLAMASYAKPWSMVLSVPGYVYLAALCAFGCGVYLNIVVSDRYDGR